MAKTPTPYEVLGILPSATDEEIKDAYRRAIQAAHPDRGGSAEKFQEIRAAFAELQRRPCPDCGGKGFITERRGAFVSKKECPRCWARN